MPIQTGCISEQHEIKAIEVFWQITLTLLKPIKYSKESFTPFPKKLYS
jgi:hypothetical protein